MSSSGALQTPEFPPPPLVYPPRPERCLSIKKTLLLETVLVLGLASILLTLGIGDWFTSAMTGILVAHLVGMVFAHIDRVRTKNFASTMHQRSNAHAAACVAHCQWLLDAGSLQFTVRPGLVTNVSMTSLLVLDRDACVQYCNNCHRDTA